MNLSEQIEEQLPTPEQAHPWYSLFLPRKEYVITPILVYANVFVFILMVAGGANMMLPEAATLIEWGGNIRRLTLDGETWRLFTSMFLHIGIVHLLFNLYALIMIGRQLENVIGSLNFAAFYVFTGLLASCTSVMWHVNTVSAGASGAIFGMFGLFIGLLVSKTVHFENRNGLLTSMATLVGYNLLFGLKSGIDNAAHLGGVISGFVAGAVAGSYLSERKPNQTSLVPALAGMLVTVAACWIGMGMTTNSLKVYEEKMKIFDVREREALAILRLDTSTPAKEIEYQLVDRGVYYWEQNIELLNSLKAVELPEPLVIVNNKLVQYCQLRIDSYKLLSKSYVEHTNQYEEQLKGYNKQIEDLIASMK